LKIRMLCVFILLFLISGCHHHSPANDLTVQGAQILRGGVPFQGMGLNVPGLEWSSVGDTTFLGNVESAIKARPDYIRIPLNDACWFGLRPDQNHSSEQYREMVDIAVDLCSRKGIYMMLDLHWSLPKNAGSETLEEATKNGRATDRRLLHEGQHCMPGDGAINFWESVAARYANRPFVIFDLYNEPHNITPQVWLNGGDVTDDNTNPKDLVSYHTPGMQQLLDAVRRTGATNLVVCGGIGWGAVQMEPIAQGFVLKDLHHNVAYDVHLYATPSTPIGDWKKQVKGALGAYPIFFNEFGPDDNLPKDATLDVQQKEWLKQFTAWADANHISYAGWCWHDSAKPNMLSMYGADTDWGIFYVDNLIQHNKSKPTSP